MKKFIKYFKWFLLFIFFFISIAFIFTLSRGDSFVNYGFSYAISKGEIPYKDFNLVISPFAPFLYSIFLIFNKSILVFYLEQALLLTLLFAIIKKFLKNKTILFLLGMILPFPIAFCTVLYPGYNFLIFFLLILLFYLEEYNKNDILIGVVLGLIFCTKQTIGLVLALPLLYYLFKDRNKFFKRILGYIIPISILILYLICTGSLYEFIDLCFLGLFDFSSGNSGFSLFYLILFILGEGYLLYKIFKNKKDITLYYGVLFGIVVYPIIDYYHVSLFLLVVLFFIIKDLKINNNLNINKSISLIILTICITWTFVTKNYFGGINFYNIHNFELLIWTDNYINNAEKLINYFDKRDNVIYFMRGSENYFFKIIDDRKLDYFDLPNKGNYGYNGINKMKKKIDNVHDKYFVLDKELLKDKNPTQQYIKELGNYVIDNSTKVKEIGIYVIYYKE